MNPSNAVNCTDINFETVPRADFWCWTAYHMIVSRMWLNRSLEGDEFMLDWRPFRSLPKIVPRPGSSTDKALKETKKLK